MIEISPEHAETRLYATLDFITSGSGDAKIHFYDGTRPAGGEPPGVDCHLLGTMFLQPVAGTIDGGVLTLLPEEDAVVITSGEPTWARCISANETWALDADCSNEAGDGDFKFEDALLAGGAIHLLVCEVT